MLELARALRPEIEQVAEFRRFLAPVLEIEQRAAARGQALNSINAQLGAHHADLDAELAHVVSQIETEQRAESDAQRQHDEREANAHRADAKLKRVQIEMRAVTQVAEQKLGPAGAAHYRLRKPRSLPNSNSAPRRCSRSSKRCAAPSSKRSRR